MHVLAWATHAGSSAHLDVLARLGIPCRQLRTHVQHDLVHSRKDWLVAQHLGRRKVHRLTPCMHHQAAAAGGTRRLRRGLPAGRPAGAATDQRIQGA
eukprot:366431-Chlamydomonas_euryale.AAC.14